MKAIHRLKKYIEYKGLNNSNFEKKNNLSNGYINTQLKRNSYLGEGVLTKILENCKDINPEWLLTGQGEMLKKNDENELNIIAMIDIERMQNKVTSYEIKIKRLEELNEVYKDEIQILKEDISIIGETIDKVN